MGQRLAAELLEASEGRGGAVKKREEVHRMAEANKAFSTSGSRTLRNRLETRELANLTISDRRTQRS
jgi:hypothetical protein